MSGSTSSTRVLAPCPGQVIPLADVPDPVFAEGMVGQGVGIEPTPEQTTVVAPVAGRVVKIHPHAFVVLAADGAGVLVHLGINTNRLEGVGFEVHAAEGDEVEVGTAMVSWDPSSITGEDRSAVVPVLVMDAKDATVTATEAGSVAAGDELFVLHR